MTDPSQLPPNQQLVAEGKWPAIGERAPALSDRPWTLSISGLVLRPRSWRLEELRSRPLVAQAIDLHCVTRWSKLAVRFAGVPLATLLEGAGVDPAARFVSFIARSERRHSSSLPCDAAASALVALEAEGAPLDELHGGPLRLVVPGRYFYKSVKWLERIELLAEDRLGYWEATAGYHNQADPWREQRYLAAGLSRREAAELLGGRNLSRRELRGLDASGRDLAGLHAAGALLRNADFSRCRLADACFDEANLSNARLREADLTRATFRGADVEGADFAGADLRGCDFRGASLVAATFCDMTPDQGPCRGARIDSSTRVDRAALDDLTPHQQRYVRRCS